MVDFYISILFITVFIRIFLFIVLRALVDDEGMHSCAKRKNRQLSTTRHKLDTHYAAAMGACLRGFSLSFPASASIIEEAFTAILFFIIARYEVISNCNQELECCYFMWTRVSNTTVDLSLDFKLFASILLRLTRSECACWCMSISTPGTVPPPPIEFMRSTSKNAQK